MIKFMVKTMFILHFNFFYLLPFFSLNSYIDAILIGIPRQTLYRWIDESEQVVADEGGELVSAAKGRESRLRKHISQLKQVLANKTLEADFFRGALQRVKARHRGVSAGGELASTTTSGT